MNQILIWSNNGQQDDYSADWKRFCSLFHVKYDCVVIAPAFT